MHEKAIAEGFDSLWGKSLERNWVLGRLGLPGGGSPIFNAPDKPGYKYVQRGAEGEEGQVIALDRIGVADVYNQRVRMRREFGEYVIREAEYLDSSGGLSTTLAGLTDVAITGLADGDIIQYDSGLGEWINTAAGGGGGSTYFAGDAIDIDGSNNISVKVNSSSAIVVDTGSNTLLVNTGDGLKITLNQLTLNLAPSPGLEYGTGVDAGKLRVDTGDGITIDASGIALNFATDPGLELVLGGGVYKVRVKEYFGIERSSNGIGVKLKTTSGLEVDIGGLAIQDAIAGNGLAIASKILSVGAGDGIDSNANDVAVDVTDFIDTAAGLKEDLANNIQVKLEANSGLQFGGVGGVQLGTPSTNSVSSINQVTTTTHGHAITTSSDVGTSLATVILAASAGTLGLAQLTIRGNLIFAGGNRSITASNNLTITPSTDLILDPTGLILTPNAQDIRTVTINDLPTGIDGYRIWNRYANYTQLTIGAIKADELYIRVFVADETRIDRGEEYWSKSFGIVQEDFTLPAVASTVDVWFEDAPAAVTFNLFAVNDYLLCRTIDWGTGLVVQKIWFQVTAAKLAQETTAVNGVDRQKWRIRRLAGGATGNLIKRGNLALDTGQVGQGWIHLSALSQDGGPFIQIGTMSSVSTVPQFTNYVRMGNLNGTVDYATNVYGFAAGSSLGTTPSGGFSGMAAEATNGLRLFNTDLDIYNSSILVLRVNRTAGVQMRDDSSQFSDARRYISWHDALPSGTRTSVLASYSSGSNHLLDLYRTDTAGTTLVRMLVDQSGSGVGIWQVSSTGGGSLIQGIADELVLGSTPSGMPVRIWGRTSVAQDQAFIAVGVLHVHENTTATSAAAGITMEQDGTGDALLQFLLTAGQRWVVGIDNSDADKFKIGNNAALGTADAFVIDTAGNVGLNQSSPLWPLHITGQADGAKFTGLAIHNNTITNNSEAAIRFVNRNISITTDANRVGEIGINGGSGSSTVFARVSDGSVLATAFSASASLFYIPNVLGIRVADPDAPLTIATLDSTTANNANQIRLRSQRTTINSAGIGLIGGIDFMSNDTQLTAPGIVVAAIQALAEVTHSTTALNTGLYFYTTTGTTYAAKLQITGPGDVAVLAGDLTVNAGNVAVLAGNLTVNAGHVGIGTNTPGTDVIGTYDYSATRLLHVESAGISSVLVHGDVVATLDLIGETGGTNKNWLRLITYNGLSTLIANDDTNNPVYNMIAMDHATGYVGINNTAPDAQLDLDTEGNNGIRSTVYSATNWFNYVARRALGTKASPTRALLNTIIGSWGGQGYTLSGWPTIASAQIQMRAAENYTATAQGSKIEFYTTLDGTTTISKQFTIENDGGIIAPYIWATVTPVPASAVNVQISSNGVLTHATSSIRYKKNVREMPGEYGDDFIMALKPIVYNMKFGDDDNDYVGFVAEDVFGIGGKPFVSFNDVGQVESLHYDKLIVPLVAAVQDLIPYKARIAQLESEMMELRARVNAMEGE